MLRACGGSAGGVRARRRSFAARLTYYSSRSPAVPGPSLVTADELFTERSQRQFPIASVGDAPSFNVLVEESCEAHEIGGARTVEMMTAQHLGMPVSLMTWPDLDKWADDAVAGRKGATVCTLAPYQAFLWRSNPRYASVLSKASVVLVDGNGVRLALAVAGTPRKNRLTGREVVQRIFDGEMLNGARVAVVGSSPESQQVLAQRRPGWLVLGGRYSSEPDATVVAETAASLDAGAIEVVLVALGCPKQELWADALIRLHPAIYFSIGGAVDTVAGTKSPPPRPVERLGVEWAWRLAQDPALAGHVSRAAQVMPSLLARAVGERLNHSSRRQRPS